MTDLPVFPDIERALMTLLSDLAATGTQTPDDLQDSMPFVRVARYGGPDDRFTDTARVDVDCFAASRDAAHTLAEQVRARLLSYPHVVGSTVIDRAITDNGPNEIPWSNDPNVRRFTAAYQVRARR